MFFKISDRKTVLCGILQLKRLFYDSRSKHDTIFAPATTILPGRGSPLVVIRVSGAGANVVLSKLTEYVTSPSELRCKIAKPRHATLARIFKPNTKELIDMGLFIWFPKPNSYTGEDICEFHVHGSRAVMKTMLNVMASIPNLRPAEPGEFTRRAVINNKMSLLQAEGLSDLIASQTDNQRKLALKGLDGTTYRRYNYWIESLTRILAHLEASIDFGEDELLGEQKVVSKCVEDLKELSKEIASFTKLSSIRRNLIHDGIKVAILGKPNAGKSTFMNLLCGSDRSIVSSLSGTTRDVVEHSIELAEHHVTLYDTAGLKDLNDTTASTRIDKEDDPIKLHESIEREGIRKAIEKAKLANLIIYLIDGSEFSNYDEFTVKIHEELKTSSAVIKTKVPLYLVINKIDLNSRLADEGFLRELNHNLRDHQVIGTCLLSCKTRKYFESFLAQLSTHLDGLMKESERQLAEGLQQPETEIIDLNYINERHTSLLNSVVIHLNKASEFEMKTLDEMAQHVRESLDYLSRIVGTVSNEQVFDIIFRDFCIGK